MTLDQLHSLGQALAELVAWLEDTRPGALDIALVMDAEVVVQYEIRKLRDLGAR
jgi:hypothetical protein